MDKKLLLQLVEEAFKTFPDNSELFATADGNVFLEMGAALNHSRMVKTSVMVFDREKFQATTRQEANVQEEATPPNPPLKTKKNK